MSQLRGWIACWWKGNWLARAVRTTHSWIWTMVTVFWVFWWPSKTQLSAMISFGASTCPGCFFSTTGVTNQHQSKLEITHEHQPLYMPNIYIYIIYIYIIYIYYGNWNGSHLRRGKIAYKYSIQKVASLQRSVFNHGGPKGTLAVYWSQEINVTKQAQVVVLKWCIPQQQGHSNRGNNME